LTRGDYDTWSAIFFSLTLRRGQWRSAPYHARFERRDSRSLCVPFLVGWVYKELPNAINDAGELVGTTESHLAALWSRKAGLREIPVPHGFDETEGVAINRYGHVVGVATNRHTNEHRGFLYADGQLTLLAGSDARPSGINDRDEIVGEAKLSAQAKSGAVLWKGPTAFDLGGCCPNRALGINNDSVIVGNAYNHDGRYQAFLWDSYNGGRVIGPSDGFSSAVAINAAGTIVIQSFSDRGIWLFKHGSLDRLSILSSRQAYPRAINECGVIVGSAGPYSDVNHAFVWHHRIGLRELDKLISATVDWKLEVATGINNRGEIVGWGQHGENDREGFLLVPSD
jgi:probable HAF family extracellular repeat protein